MHDCLFTKKVAELDGLKECSRILGRIYTLSITHVRDEKRAGRGGNARMQVLPSMLFAREAAQKAISVASYTQAARTAAELRSKVAECIHRVERNTFLSQLDNDTKRNIAGFAGRYGIYTVKAARFHGVDAEMTRLGFLEAIETYTAGRKEDAELEDEISGYTQEEFFLDAQNVLPLLKSSVRSIVDILQKVPLLGRTLTILPMCDGAAMNPWLLEVSGLPTFVKVMSSYDLLHTLPEVLNMRANRSRQQLLGGYDGEFDGYRTEPNSDDDDGAWVRDDNDGGRAMHERKLQRNPPPETINHLLLLPGSVGGAVRAGWMHQAATYLQLRNETLYYSDAWMATMASTVAFLLGKHADVSVGWIQEELDRVLCAFKTVYSPEKIYTYLALMGSPEDHRQTLVSSGDWLPRGISCPHLTKPLFALWLLAVDAKVKLSADDLFDRHCGFLVEFFSRSKLSLPWKKQRWLMEVYDWIEDCHPLPRPLLPIAPTFEGALAGYERSLGEALRAVKAADVLQPPELDMGAIMAVEHFQFSVGFIGAAFANLARLFGIADYNHNAPVERPLLLAKLLELGAVGSSLERTALPCTFSMPAARFFQLGTQPELQKFRKLAAETGRLRFKFCFEYEMLQTHKGPAMTITPAYVDYFQAKWGLNIASKLGVRKCGLSAVACTSPSCPYFFQPLNDVPPGGGIGPKLGLHLKSLHVVPGFHKAVQALIEDGLADDADAMDHTAGMVIQGRFLEDTPPCVARLAAVRDKQLRPYASAVTLGSYALSRVADINAGYEIDMKATKIAYNLRLKERMNTAFNMREVYYRGANVWLQSLMKDIVAGTYTWDYEQFEAVVLGSPFVRCGWSGRFLVEARP